MVKLSPSQVTYSLGDMQCDVEGCAKQAWARGYCTTHYSRWRIHGDPGPAGLLNHPQKGLVCQVEGCELASKTKGYCSTHYARWRTAGDAGSGEIKRGKPRGAACEVDGCARLSAGDGLCRMHYERRRKGKPLGGAKPQRRAAGEGSVSRGYKLVTVNGRPMLEHRHVMEQILGRSLLPTERIHHRDGDGLNNKPSNLELWNTAHPAGKRVEDLVAFAHEIIDLYGKYGRCCLDCGSTNVEPITLT